MKPNSQSSRPATSGESTATPADEVARKARAATRATAGAPPPEKADSGDTTSPPSRQRSTHAGDAGAPRSAPTPPTPLLNTLASALDNNAAEVYYLAGAGYIQTDTSRISLDPGHWLMIRFAPAPEPPSRTYRYNREDREET